MECDEREKMMGREKVKKRQGMNQFKRHRMYLRVDTRERKLEEGSDGILSYMSLDM